MIEQRSAIILEKLDKYGNVEVSQLSKELQVTEKTIRHDLARMEKQGLLKRVHGGAVSTRKKLVDAYDNRARTVSLKNKENAARAAYAYFSRNYEVGQVIFIDAGTTNYEFARYLKNLSLTVITNDLFIASELATMGDGLHVTGGRLSNNVNKYMTGPDALAMINRHSFSTCFIGASAISLANGFMTHTNEDAEIKQAVIRHSACRICLADHTKFGQNSFVKFADWNDINVLITDTIDPDTLAQFESKGITVITGDSINANTENMSVH